MVTMILYPKDAPRAVSREYREDHPSGSHSAADWAARDARVLIRTNLYSRIEIMEDGKRVFSL